MTELGPHRAWLDGHNDCTFNLNPAGSSESDCRKPSTLHIMLRGDDGYVAACAEHAPIALRLLPVEQWHAWGTWCNLPGALWFPSPTPDEADSYCALDDSADASSRAREAVVAA